MRSFLTAIVCLVLVLAGRLVRGQEALAEKDLERLKAATVYIRASVPGTAAMGSGFVIEKSDSSCCVATNAHVVGAMGTPAQSVECVFFSGTDRELTKTATIAGYDRDRDLAVLVVQGDVASEPLDLKTKINVRETLPVYVIGFPFGELFGQGPKGPAVTVSLQRVSSIRRDGQGRAVAIQIDGGIHPGNSGGPLVDANGVLVGIAVAKIRNDPLAFAIPAAELAEMLLGRVASITTAQTGVHDNRVELSVNTDLIDPKNRIRSVHFEVIQSQRLPTRPTPNADGSWLPLPGRAKSVPLKIESGKAAGKVVLEAENGIPTAYTFQIRCVRSNGKPIYTQPDEFVVGGSTPGTPVAKPDTHPQSSISKSKRKDKDIVIPSAGLELAEFPGRRREIILPGPFDDLEVGGAGRYFIFQSHERGELAIVDLNRLEVVKTLPVPIDAKTAAGLDRLLIAMPFDRKIEVWSLAQMQRIKAASFPFRGTIKAMAMGCAADSPLLVHWADSTDQMAQPYFSLVNPRSVKPLIVSGIEESSGQTNQLAVGSEGEFQVNRAAFSNGEVQIRGAATGNAFGIWHANRLPEGLLAVLLDGQAVRVIYQHDSPGHVNPSADGTVLCLGRGYATADLSQKAADAWCLPTYDARYLILLTGTGPPALLHPGMNPVGRLARDSFRPYGPQKSVSILDLEAGRPVHQFTFVEPEAPTGNNQPSAHQDQFAFDKRYHCIPEAGCLVVVPDSNDRLIVERIGFEFVPALRTWTDASGEFTTAATFVSLTDGQVTLRKKDGKEITLPMSKLSDVDTAYIRGLEVKARRREELAKSAAETSSSATPADHEESGVAAPAEVTDSPTPSSDAVAPMEVVYTSIRLKGWTIRVGSHLVGKSDPPVDSPTQVGPFTVGQSLYVAFNLANASNNTIRISAGPNIVSKNIGTIQTWIELLARKPANATPPTNRAAGSISGAAGGMMVSSPPVLRPGDVAVNGRWPLPPNLVAGHYRYTFEFRKSSGEVLQSESVEFDVLSEETK
ncbi:MAG: trypsin-like peptidase domain-containing protein [Pirellulaceae bacterium]